MKVMGVCKIVLIRERLQNYLMILVVLPVESGNRVKKMMYKL